MTKFEQDMTVGMATLTANVSTVMEDMKELKKDGCAQGRVDRARIDALELGGQERWEQINKVKSLLTKHPEPDPDSESDGKQSGSWISYGKLKAAGLPAIVVAVIIFLHYWQTIRTDQVAADMAAKTEQVAQEVRVVKVKREQALDSDMERLANMLYDRLASSGKLKEIRPDALK